MYAYVARKAASSTFRRSFTMSAVSSSLKGTFSSEFEKAIVNKSLLKNAGLVSGQYTNGSASELFDVIDPGSGKVIGSLPDMTQADTAEAIVHAKNGFDAYKKTSPYQRAKWLNKWLSLMQENSDDIARMITFENGKTFKDAKGEVAYSNSFVEWYAAEAVRNYGDTIPSAFDGVTNLVVRQPVGVCGIITPWNFPIAMVTRKLGAALAAGCTSVIKAPSETPYSVLAACQLAIEAGFPEDSLHVITTHRHTAEVGKELCTNETVKKVSFTGSTRVGKLLMSQSSDTLKKLSFELGGNAPFIVFEDADIDAAVQGALISKFRTSGQTCVCANRLFVHEDVYDEFAAKFVAEIEKLKVGNGFAPESTHGPVVHENALKKVEQHVSDAVSKGAKILTGGKRIDTPGYFHELTVLADVTDECLFGKEETFGPVAALHRFSSEEEVLKRANNVNVGLAGYFYSKDLGRISRVASEMEVGMVGANTGLLSQVSIPFGGVKESGFGREGSKYGLSEYQVMKLIALGGVSL